MCSLAPSEYMSAVSKKVTPESTALRTIGSAASSRSAQARSVGSPKLIIPRQIRDTFRPVCPNRAYCMSYLRSVTLMHGDAGCDQTDPEQVQGAGKLAENHGADDRGEHGEQREHERDRRSGEPRHGELVEAVGDDRRADAPAGA